MQRASSTAITPVKISSMPSLDPVAMPAEPAASPSSEPLLPKRDDEEREAILSGNCQRDPAGRMIAPASPQSISGGSSCCHLIPSPKHASTPLSNKVGLNKSAISEQDKDATTQQQQQQQHCEGGTEERQFLSIKPLSTTTSALQDHKHLNVCTAVKEFQFGNVGDDSECSFICNSECSEDSPAVDHVKTQTGSLEAEADLAKTHHLEKSANSSLVPKEKTLKRRKIADYIAENKAKRKKKLDTMEDGELEESDEDISIVNIVKNSRSPDCRPKQRNKRGQRKQHRRRHYYSNSDSSSTSNSLTSSSPSSFGDGQSESDDSLEIIEEGPLTSRHGHHSGVVAEKSTVVNAREENKSDINLPLQEALAHTSEQVLATVSDAALAQPPIALRPLAHLEQGGIRHDLHESLSGGEQLDYEPFSESYAEESDSVEVRN